MKGPASRGRGVGVLYLPEALSLGAFEAAANDRSSRHGDAAKGLCEPGLQYGWVVIYPKSTCRCMRGVVVRSRPR